VAIPPVEATAESPCVRVAAGLVRRRAPVEGVASVRRVPAVVPRARAWASELGSETVRPGPKALPVPVSALHVLPVVVAAAGVASVQRAPAVVPAATAGVASVQRAPAAVPVATAEVASVQRAPAAVPEAAELASVYAAAVVWRPEVPAALAPPAVGAAAVAVASDVMAQPPAVVSGRAEVAAVQPRAVVSSGAGARRERRARVPSAAASAFHRVRLRPGAGPVRRRAAVARLAHAMAGLRIASR
jgi:hypothetical protein